MICININNGKAHYLYLINYIPFSFKKVLLWLVFFLITILSFSQPNRRTNHWYFSDSVGLDFSSGYPAEDIDGRVLSPYGYEGSTVMSDTIGNLLFYCDGQYVWHKNHDWMKNDFGYPAIERGYQGTIAFPKPGSDHLYYVFIVSRCNGIERLPLYYFTIDMLREGGLGEVMDIDTLSTAWDAADKLTATYHENKKDIWVVTRKFNMDSYAAFLVTDQGVYPDPVLSPAPNRELSWGPANFGPVKISPDKHFLISTFEGNQSQIGGFVEVCKFNAATGIVSFMYSFQMKTYFFPTQIPHYEEVGCEFSPCSNFLYVAAEIQHPYNPRTHIYQFNMDVIDDSATFIQSGVLIDTIQGSNLQLASDGRIYCLGKAAFHYPSNPDNNKIGRINNPGLLGSACEYEADVVEVQHGQITYGTVNFLTDYLLRFDFAGQCALDTFYFDPWFFPEPTWIQWDFDDPASGSQNTSHNLYPQHVFTHGGEFEVSVLLTYPNGRVENTSRVVEVDSVPWPDLGPDTLICQGSSLTLSSNCNGNFLWSTGQWGTSSITVSDSGLYWVRASYANGCDNYDSIYIGFHPGVEFDETGLVITPTGCGGTSGSITGLSALGTPPLAYLWMDLSGNSLGTDPDLFNLGVGQYYLSVTDGNGCANESPLYTITDAGNLQVDSVSVSGSACGQNNGLIQVYAVPLPGGQLFYSIDNGQNFYDNGGLFENLPPGEYSVMIQDENDCQGVYTYNPVHVDDLLAPQLISATSLPEVDFLQNGEIILEATGSTTSLYYSIDNGVSWQTNNGTFTGLVAGIYDCIITDENDCDTNFQVEVERFWATILKAVVENVDTCSGTIFEIPIKVQNFNDVSKFRMHLSYNRDMIECTGFAEPHSAIADSLQAFINDATGDILFLWNDDTPGTLPDQTSMVKLIFSDRTTGEDVIEWYSQAEESYFLKSTADTLKAEFTLGTVRISSPPQILWINDMVLCQGEELLAFPLVEGSNPILERYWIKPDGGIQIGIGLIIDDIQPAQSGPYTFIATDDRGCTSEKSILVTVIPTPDPAIPNGDTLFIDEGEELDAGAGFLSYLWNTGSTGQTIPPSIEGWYSVTVTTTNDCQATDSVYVTFREEPVIEPSQYFYIPNAFTPDGDGRNDEFRLVPAIESLSIVDCRLSIFDRWGGRVFEGDGISKGWDGTKNGRECPAGAYIYRITFKTDEDPSEKMITGTVAVIR